jgi:hypothetical protein
MERYAIEWNALDAFCRDISTDPAVLERFAAGTYTELDLQVLAHFITSASAKQLFANDAAVEEFLSTFLH